MALELVYNGNIASVDALISVAPENVPGRIMNNKKQMLYDINKSNLIFIAKSKNISTDIKRKFIYRIIGRCAKWRKRE